MGDFLLLTPGPTEVPKRVLDTQSVPMIHHRTKDYQAILERVNRDLQRVFCTAQPVLTFASSGTGAMEGSILNLLRRGDKVLSVSAGKWGERYRDIARVYGLDVKSYELPYGQAVTPEAVGQALKEHADAKAVLLTLCETSTAVTHPVKDVAALTRNSGALLMVDAISGLGCDELRMDDWGVDVVVCGSQKGLMLPPGLSFVAINERAVKMIERSDLPKYYFNFADTLKALKKNDTPFTPAVSLVRGLEEALKMLLEEGMEQVWARHERVARRVRSEVSAMGLKLFAQRASNALTAIVMPDGVASKDVIKTMRDTHKVIMADGQGELQGKIVRFAHMGAACTDAAADRGLTAFRDALEKAGYAAAARR
ncbi:MAG: Serine-pyruvate aminotransferase [Candidatus Omnitrophica bacterium]|nr:Serine-pyruvate aminotransferase [Candidatus Omnitrophota bacterium]